MLRVAAVALALALAGAQAAAAATDPLAAGQKPLSIMRVPQALAAAGPLRDVPVMAPDTGIDLDHPDLAPRLFRMPSTVAAPDPEGHPGTVVKGSYGWDVIGTSSPSALAPDADPSDPAGDSGHGTLVSGVLGAARGNGVGGSGVAPNARLIALRTCWDGDQCYGDVEASSIEWAIARGARVISMSWLQGSPLNPDFAAAIRNHPGVLFVAIPSGNGGTYDSDGANPLPCSVSSGNVLCVSVSSLADGLDCAAYGRSMVDVAVPTTGNVATRNGGGYAGTGCATSFAAPEAAGIATILFGIDPTASAAAVRGAIVDGARRVPAWSGRSVSGGVADAARSVALFRARRGLGMYRPGSGSTGRDRVKPRVKIALRRHRFRSRRATLRVRVSERARVTVTLRRRGHKRTVRLGRLRRGLHLRSLRRLRLGRYRAVAVAVDAAGNRGRSHSLRFRRLS